MGEEDVARRRTTRENLLLSAREMVLERFRAGVSGHDALAYLTPAAVAERAGVSRGTIYHYWGEHEDPDGGTPFERFLGELAELFWNDAVDIEDLDLLASILPENLTDLILEFSDFELTRLTTGDDAVMFRVSTTMVLHGVDLSTQFHQSVDQLARIYESVLPRLGRRTTPPLTTRDLALAIAMLSAGAVVSELHEEGCISAPVSWHGDDSRHYSEKPWTLFAVAAESLMFNMTELVADGPSCDMGSPTAHH